MFFPFFFLFLFLLLKPTSSMTSLGEKEESALATLRAVLGDSFAESDLLELLHSHQNDTNKAANSALERLDQGFLELTALLNLFLFALPGSFDQDVVFTFFRATFDSSQIAFQTTEKTFSIDCWAQFQCQFWFWESNKEAKICFFTLCG